MHFCACEETSRTADLTLVCLGLQVGLNLDVSGVESFIKARMGKVIDMDGCTGLINTFIIEPFVPHSQEYYLCIQSKRLGSDISFSEAGGVEIEANWDKACTAALPRLPSEVSCLSYSYLY